MKNIEKKQQALKDYIQQLGWTNNTFARRWYYEKYDSDVESEILKFEDRLKKTTSEKNHKRRSH
jgi:hypothetical protein